MPWHRPSLTALLSFDLDPKIKERVGGHRGLFCLLMTQPCPGVNEPYFRPRFLDDIGRRHHVKASGRK